MEFTYCVHIKAFKLSSRARDNIKKKKRSLFAFNISMIALSLIITIISIGVVIIIIIIIEENILHRYGIDSLNNIRTRLPVKWSHEHQMRIFSKWKIKGSKKHTKLKWRTNRQSYWNDKNRFWLQLDIHE